MVGKAVREGTRIYIQPLFLAAEDKGGLPELRRVIVAYENDVVMEENLEQALMALSVEEKLLHLQQVPP